MYVLQSSTLEVFEEKAMHFSSTPIAASTSLLDFAELVRNEMYRENGLAC